MQACIQSLWGNIGGAAMASAERWCFVQYSQACAPGSIPRPNPRALRNCIALAMNDHQVGEYVHWFTAFLGDCRVEAVARA
ncbi:MAG: hypothetical protein ACREAC_16940 [Blastocatellia bacterium]